MYPAPLGAVSFTYDGISRVNTMTDGKGQATSFSYDSLDRETQVSYQNNSPAAVVMTFDGAGNMKALTDQTGTTSWAYDSLNRQTQKTLPNANIVTYGWDGESNMTTRTDVSGTTTYSYNQVNSLATLTNGSNETTTFHYDNAQRRTQEAMQSGVTINDAYDAGGQLTSIQARASGGSLLVSRSYSYIIPGTNTTTAARYSMSDQAGNTTSYAYDALERLTSAQTKNSGGTVTDNRSYGYDPVGNRSSQTINGTVTDYAYNAANELCWTASTSGTCASPPSGATSYGYDANGMETSRTDGLFMTYDASDRMVSMGYPGQATASEYYTGTDQTQRTRGGTTSYQYDLTGLTERTAGAPNNTYYVLRDTGGQILSEHGQSGGTNYYISDAVGSTIGLVDANGNNISSYNYDPFGNVLGQSGPLTTPFQFEGGKFLDWWNGITKLGTRYYDSSVGRWTQMDPLPGKTANPQTLNRYPFALDNPGNLTDPSGASDCAAGMVAALLSLGAVAANGADLYPLAFALAGGAAVIDVVNGNYVAAGFDVVAGIPIFGAAFGIEAIQSSETARAMGTFAAGYGFAFAGAMCR